MWHSTCVGQLLACRWCSAIAQGAPGRRSSSAAELGATGYGAEVAAMSTPHQRSGKYLGAMTHGVETCYLGATSHGADPLDPKTQFVLLRVYLWKSFARKVRKQKMRVTYVLLVCLLKLLICFRSTMSQFVFTQQWILQMLQLLSQFVFTQQWILQMLLLPLTHQLKLLFKNQHQKQRQEERLE